MSRLAKYFRGPLMAAVLGAASLAATAVETISHGYFDNVRVERPTGDVRRFVLLLAGRKDDAGAVAGLVRDGAMVARIDASAFYAKLSAESGACTGADGALENLSRHLQAYYRLPTYLAPILVGRDIGAALTYGMAVQSLPGALVGAVSIDFCPVLPAAKPLCERAGLLLAPRQAGGGFDIAPAPTLAAPWVALQTTPAGACLGGPAAAVVAAAPQAALGTVPERTVDTALAAAVRSLGSHQKPPAPPPTSLSDLPIVEIPADPGSPGSERMAILLSGDGGWAGIDKGIAASLAKRGIPTAGFDSLRYFWSKRTPEGLANDLDRLIRYYTANWKRPEVLLIGFSQGADVLPFAVNRLPAATRAKVRSTALLGLGQKASFEFHLSNWLGPSGDRPIAPEAQRLLPLDTLCIHGQREPHSLCPSLAPAHVSAVLLPGDHHFDGAHDRLVAEILGHADRTTRR